VKNGGIFGEYKAVWILRFFFLEHVIFYWPADSAAFEPFGLARYAGLR
jgi:hypothetical protein